MSLFAKCLEIMNNIYLKRNYQEIDINFHKCSIYNNYIEESIMSMTSNERFLSINIVLNWMSSIKSMIDITLETKQFNIAMYMTQRSIVQNDHDDKFTNVLIETSDLKMMLFQF